MTWEIVLGIISLVGLIGTFVGVCVKLVVPLTESIVRLTDNVRELCDKFNAFGRESAKEHDEIWRHNDEQDRKLEDHAQRLHDLDGKW